MRKLVLFLFSLFLLQHAFSQVGNYDTSFGYGGITAPLNLNIYFDKMGIQPDGKIVVAGYYYNNKNADWATVLVRFNLDGSWDKGFGTGGGYLLDHFFAADGYPPVGLAVQSDGRLLVSGPHGVLKNNRYYGAFAVTRYTKNGRIDSSFGMDGRAITSISTTDASGNLHWLESSATSVAVESNGEILVAGNCLTYGNPGPSGALVRYTQNGAGKATQLFNSGFAPVPNPFIVTYPSGGYAMVANGANNKLYLYSSRFGEKELNLTENNREYSSGLRRLAILNDEKLAVITTNPGTVSLLNKDGSFDTGFSDDGTVALNFQPLAVAVQKDGKIVVDYRGLERFNQDGTLDLDFDKKFEATDVFAYGSRIYELNYGLVSAFQADMATRYVKVDLYGNDDPYVNREWNNWNNLHDLHFNHFSYSDSTISNISAVMSNRNGVNDNGADYSSGMAPAGVLRHSSYSIGSRTITFSGLAANKKYSIELYASRNAYPTDSTIFNINGVLKKIGTYRNFTNKASFTNLSPNAQGQIVLAISSTRMYNYLDGFVLTESYSTSEASTQPMVIAKQTTVLPAFVETNIRVFPNPTQQAFSIQLISSSNAIMQLRVVDASGRVLETKQNIAPNTTFSIGQQYKAGIYYVELIQGSQHKLIKLVKTSN